MVNNEYFLNSQKGPILRPRSKGYVVKLREETKQTHRYRGQTVIPGGGLGDGQYIFKGNICESSSIK